MARFEDDVTFTKKILCNEGAISVQDRTSILRQDELVRFPILLTSLRQDGSSYATPLTNAAASTNLGLVGGTFGTSPPAVQAGNCGTSGGAITRRARFQVAVPECYEAAETIELIATAGITGGTPHVADASCTILFEAYRVTKGAFAIGSNLVTTTAQDMNFTVFAEIPFTIDGSGLAPGDTLDCRVTIVCNDAATTAANVVPCVPSIDLACDIKG